VTGVQTCALPISCRAVELYTRALALAPGEHGVRLNLAIAYYRMARFDLAEPELARVLAAEPDNRQARLLRGLCLLETDRVPEATAELERVHRAEPDNLGASYGLALAYIAANQLDKAAVLADAVFSRIDSAEAHLVMGSLASAKRDFKTAVDELSQARAINPKLPTVNARLGSTYLMSGDRESAVRAFEAELEVNPLDYEANARLAALYREDGRLDEASARIRKALELRPGDPWMLYQSAQVAQAGGRPEEAVALLERVVAAMPDFNPAHVLLARLYFKLKRPEDAARERAIVERLTADQQKRAPGGNARPQETDQQP